MPTINNIVTCPYGDVKIPDNQTLFNCVFANADQFANETALVDGTTGSAYTYRELVTAIKCVASGLSKLCFKQGDVLCLYSPNCPEWAITYFAVIALGGVATTANPLYTHSELEHQLEDARATFIATLPDMLPKVQQAKRNYTKLKKTITFGEAPPGYVSFSRLLADDGSAFKEASINVKMDVAVLPYSSGTTGLPKGVMLTHYNLVANICQFTSPAFIQASIGDCYIAVLPFYHIYGQINVLAGGLKSGATIVTLPKLDPELYLNDVEKYKATRLFVVPPMALFLAKDPRVDKYDISSVKEIFCGAAPLSKDLEQAVKDRLKCNIRQGYGMTELSPTCHISPQDGGKTGSAGVVIHNTESKIVDLELGHAVGPYKEGEVCVRGPQVMKGYLNNPEATAFTIDKQGWLHTGDIGYYDSDGHFFVVDRLKELIKYKGFQVPPAELEGLLLTHPALADCGVVGVPDDVAGELPKAFVVTKPNANITESDVFKFIQDQVAPHKWLRGGVEFINEIPKSPSGKILRRMLKDMIKDRLMKAKL